MNPFFRIDSLTDCSSKGGKSFVISGDFTMDVKVAGKELDKFFRKIYALLVGSKMKPERKSVFLCSEKNQPKFSCKTCWKSNYLFSI